MQLVYTKQRFYNASNILAYIFAVVFNAKIYFQDLYVLFYEFVSYNLLYINIWTIYCAKDIVFA